MKNAYWRNSIVALTSAGLLIFSGNILAAKKSSKGVHSKSQAGTYLDYADASLAMSSIKDYNMGISLNLSAGKHLKEFSKKLQNVFLEVELTKSLLAPSLDVTYTEVNGFDPITLEPRYQSTTDTYTVSYFSVGAYGVYKYRIKQVAGLSARGRAGFAMLSSSCSPDCGSERNTGLSFGAGVVYDIKKDYDIIAEWTQLQITSGGDPLNHIYGGIQYKF